MPYNFTTFGGLKTQLALRLQDAAQIYWLNAEMGLYLTESLRTFGLCSGFWRARGNVTTVANTAFYDIQQLLTDGSQFFLQPTVTDQAIIQQLQYMLLEPAVSQTSWLGTEMFTYQDLANAVQNRLNQFLSDTGCVVNVSLVNVASPPIGRQQLDQKTVDVRRVAWIGSAPESYYTTLWREDERLLTAADQGWSVNPGAPEAYSIMAPPPLQLQIAPIPQSNGQLELLTVDSATLNPANGPTVLGIPDDLTPAIKWGALADLLGKDGEARDPVRAQYAEQRYQIYVTLARMLPVVIHSELNGVPLIPSTLQEMDASTPGWENITASPGNPVMDLILAAPNLIAISAVPDQAYSVTLDVVRKTPIYNDGDNVQIGREQLDAILDYAEHLALFKVGGAEWHATERGAQNFMLQAITYNQRISAAARASVSAAVQSQRQKQAIPRRIPWGAGVGALTSGSNAGR
jgi:hypothetical protein